MARQHISLTVYMYLNESVKFLNEGGVFIISDQPYPDIPVNRNKYNVKKQNKQRHYSNVSRLEFTRNQCVTI